MTSAAETLCRKQILERERKKDRDGRGLTGAKLRRLDERRTEVQQRSGGGRTEAALWLGEARE